MTSFHRVSITIITCSSEFSQFTRWEEGPLCTQTQYMRHKTTRQNPRIIFGCPGMCASALLVRARVPIVWPNATYEQGDDL